MGWINNEGSMASFENGGKVKKKPSYKKTKQERKMEVIKAKESPWEKGKLKKSKKSKK